jgi:3-oxoacyl-[acyl-carrier-protein] synthase II
MRAAGGAQRRGSHHTVRATPEFDVRFAAEVKGFRADDYLDRKEAKRMDRFTQLAMAAAQQALQQAGTGGTAGWRVDYDRVGVVIGSGIGGIATFEEQTRVLVERGPKRISPFFVPMFIPDIAAGHVSMRYGLRGPNYCTVSACASSAHAVGDAFRLIERGDADVMVTGGTEASVTGLAIAGFANMRALSTRNDSPETASRPFDASATASCWARAPESWCWNRWTMRGAGVRRSWARWWASGRARMRTTSRRRRRRAPVRSWP